MKADGHREEHRRVPRSEPGNFVPLSQRASRCLKLRGQIHPQRQVLIENPAQRSELGLGL
jgi:hypothetical protein